MRSSTRTGHDTITDFNAGQDHVTLTFGVTQVESEIDNIVLTKHGFDADLAAATVGLGVHHAVLVTANNASPYDGHVFLVIDKDGTAGYQAGHDLIIDVTA